MRTKISVSRIKVLRIAIIGDEKVFRWLFIAFLIWALHICAMLWLWTRRHRCAFNCLWGSSIVKLYHEIKVIGEENRSDRTWECLREHSPRRQNIKLAAISCRIKSFYNHPRVSLGETPNNPNGQLIRLKLSRIHQCAVQCNALKTFKIPNVISYGQ